MLKRVERQVLKDENDICVLAKDAKFPSPFESRLEFSCSARGTWNIAHTGMLIPEAHEVFIYKTVELSSHNLIWCKSTFSHNRIHITICKFYVWVFFSKFFIY